MSKCHYIIHVQVSVCVGMGHGDILKMDLSSVGDSSQEDQPDAAVILKPLVKVMTVVQLILQDFLLLSECRYFYS